MGQLSLFPEDKFLMVFCRISDRLISGISILN